MLSSRCRSHLPGSHICGIPTDLTKELEPSDLGRTLLERDLRNFANVSFLKGKCLKMVILGTNKICSLDRPTFPLPDSKNTVFPKWFESIFEQKTQRSSSAVTHNHKKTMNGISRISWTFSDDLELSFTLSSDFSPSKDFRAM